MKTAAALQAAVCYSPVCFHCLMIKYTQMMHDVISLLDAMEQELKRLALWEGLPPSPEAMASTTPFCMDTLRLSQWLQWIFIPRVRAIIDHGAGLPVGANMTPYAEEALAVDGVHSAVLLDIIGQFDQLMS